MTNFYINLVYPLLFLLIIPAIFFTLLSYFRQNKKYRRNRNRIISVVLHSIIMILCTTVLVGVTFEYDTPNSENEIMLLVDASYSNEEALETKNAFVKSVIEENASRFKIGVVTFGFDQIYSAELSSDGDKVYRDYESAILNEVNRPDGSATNFAEAISFAREKLTNPELAKMIIISDGFETDGNALSIIKSIAADGVTVDTVRIASEHGPEVQISNVEFPDYSITVGSAFKINVTLRSSFRGEGLLTLTDNPLDGGEIKEARVQTTFSPDSQVVEMEYVLDTPGVHEMQFNILSDGDTVAENNTYYSFVNIQAFNKVLILERNNQEGLKLDELLSGAYGYEVKRVSVSNSDGMPATLDDLRRYDQVILANIAAADVSDEFVNILNSYVHDFGGGLLTVGGSREEDGKTVANAYNRSDLSETEKGRLLQKMLPVQAIDYTPPVGVMIVIDRSGSMDAEGGAGKTKLDLAKEGAVACIDALSERDYCGIMTLESDYHEDAPIMPVTQRKRIEDAIFNIETGGGTMYAGAIERAGNALAALTNVERRHIILVTDGEPGDSEESYLNAAAINFEKGITLSVFVLGNKSMEKLAAAGGGRAPQIRSISELSYYMREDLNVPDIKDVQYETFIPKIRNHTSVVTGVTQSDMPSLDGFYGTKAKPDDGVTVTLMGEYVPIYAQWKFGKGSVGSFMCDLNGVWSQDFLEKTAGQTIINNMVRGLFPTQDISPKEIEADFREDNYTTRISVYTDLKEDESIEVMVIGPSSQARDNNVQVINPSASEGYSRVSYIMTRPGVHEVVIYKKDANGNILSEYRTYRVFSYSEEYNVFTDEETAVAFMRSLASDGKGEVIELPSQVFNGIKEFAHHMIDPRFVLIIICIILFLLDIAVRKFKFKWPHELIREYREKRNTVKV